MSDSFDHGVFLSYSREDLPAAKQIQQILQDQGISVWRDQISIYGGQQWPKAIGEGIAVRSLFVLIWSKEAAISHFVEFEWNTALALKKVIIPIRLDDTPLPPSLQALNAIPLATISDSKYLQELLKKSAQPDLNQRRAVIKKLEQIPDGASEMVVAEAKAIFQQEGWKVGGNVIQIHGGNVTINDTTGNPKGQKEWFKKGEIWFASIAGIFFIIIILNYRAEDISSHQDEFFLTVSIHGPNGPNEALNYGNARVKIGEYQSPPKEVENGEVDFVNIPAKYMDDSVKLEFLSKPYIILNQSAFTPKDNRRITFNVQPALEYITVGGIVYENGNRIAGAIVEFDGGIAQDTTGTDGKFDLTVPKSPGDFTVLSIIYNGQERFRREIMLSKNELYLTLDPL
jgi:hypothetical protein